MIGRDGENDDTDFDDVDDESVEDVLDDEDTSDDDEDMPDIGGDTMLDISAEINVEELVAKIDASDPDEKAHQREVRKRLEEIREQKDQDLDSTFNFNLDDEL